MTYIQPAKKDILNRIIIMLSLGIVFGVLFLVIIYNRVVDMEHGISAMRAEIKTAQAENAELQEKTLALFAPANFTKIIAGNLIKDTSPEYLEVWPGTTQPKTIGLR